MSDPVDRYAFGANWQRYLKSDFSEERAEIARTHLLSFLKLERLDGRNFLDIGSGSGVHSLAAWRSGADVVSFDYDPQSVAATRALHAAVGATANWRILQGSVLDETFMNSLGRFDIVYSWGVLHHTGDQWRAFSHAAARLEPKGRLYVALYASEVHCDPTPEQWLEIKQRYNAAGPLRRMAMEARQLWTGICYRRWSNVLALPRIARDYAQSRGMALMADIRDWLGGWPMEFSTIPEVIAHADDAGLGLAHLSFGEGNTEYLFCHRDHMAELGLEPTHAAALIPPPTLRHLTDLPQRPFLIFGTARGAEILVSHLQRCGGPPLAGFIDLERTEPLLGLPVLSVEQAAAQYPLDTPVVLSNRHVMPNATRLRDHGFSAIWNGHPLVVALNARKD